jgi:predicted protein tyrosine phosphatase
MEFLILPHHLAKKIVEMRTGECNVISVEANETVNPKLCKNHLQLKIDDIQDWHIERWDKDLKAKGIVYPEKKHIMEAIDFDKKCNHKIHIIHCHAGISRSPAVGYAILRARGKSKQDAMREIMRIQPHADPNKRIVRLTDEIFG